MYILQSSLLDEMIVKTLPCCYYCQKMFSLSEHVCYYSTNQSLFPCKATCISFITFMRKSTCTWCSFKTNYHQKLRNPWDFNAQLKCPSLITIRTYIFRDMWCGNSSIYIKCHTNNRYLNWYFYLQWCFMHHKLPRIILNHKKVINWPTVYIIWNVSIFQ